MAAEEPEVKIPSQFNIDIKIEQTQKGARVTVHAFGTGDDATITRALHTYISTMERLRHRGEIVAPIEISPKTTKEASA